MEFVVVIFSAIIGGIIGFYYSETNQRKSFRFQILIKVSDVIDANTHLILREIFDVLQEVKKYEFYTMNEYIHNISVTRNYFEKESIVHKNIDELWEMLNNIDDIIHQNSDSGRVKIENKLDHFFGNDWPTIYADRTKKSLDSIHFEISKYIDKRLRY